MCKLRNAVSKGHAKVIALRQHGGCRGELVQMLCVSFTFVSGRTDLGLNYGDLGLVESVDLVHARVDLSIDAASLRSSAEHVSW
jgi:hypothetical protein